jgi:CBS domain-containing protein
VATTVRDLMTTDPVTLPSKTAVQEAARRMRADDIGDVLVEDDGQLRGIVTDRDLVVRVLSDGIEPGSITLGEVCSGDLNTVSPDDELAAAVRVLREHAVRRIPVVEEGTAVGIVAIGDRRPRDRARRGLRARRYQRRPSERLKVGNHRIR